MQRATGRTGPHSASHRPCLPGDTQAPGLGCSSMGHTVQSWVMSSWSWDTHLLAVHRGLRPRPSPPSLRLFSQPGFLIPTVSPISSPPNSAVHPHLFTDHVLGGCWKTDNVVPAGRAPSQGTPPSTESIGLHCYLQLEALSLPKAPCFGSSGCIPDMALNLHREEEQDAWLHITARPRWAADGLSLRT